MPIYKTEYAATLLQKHQPNQHAYLCSEIDLTPNEISVAKIDAAYAELTELGFMEEISDIKIMIFAGGIPKSPFKITDAGIDARKH